ncbi:MAG: pyridoxal phosphate-dependent aminotransferase [Candidatus Baldrarchaeia archaeon]
MFNVYEFFNKLSESDVEIRLDAGQPDIRVDERIIGAMFDSIRRGETEYVSTVGIRELRERIAELYDVDAEEVIISPGSKLLIASQVFFSRKIAVIAPFWPAYVHMASLFGKKIQVLETSMEGRWVPDFTEMDDEVDLVIINYPNNPTGVALPRSKMRELLDVASERGITVVSDEVYRDILFNSRFSSILDFNYEKGVFVHSFSKTFSMTGFRIGFAIANREIIKKIQRFIEATVTCVPGFVQAAALKALEVIDEVRRIVSDIYKRRVEAAKKTLGRKFFEFVEPDGAIYIFPKIKAGISGTEFTYKLLKQGVSVFPGEAFGNYKQFVRVSLVSDRLEEAFRRMNMVAEECSGR